MTMRGATCFSGIGAPEMGLPDCDWVWHAEIEPFPSAVMAAWHPESINLGDVLAADFIERAKALGPLDIMAGGPPCQAFSIAGLRNSMSDPRGNLTLRWVQILHAIKPRNAITENVPGWLNTPDNAFGCFLAGLVGADDALRCPTGDGWPGEGMVEGPRARAAWRLLDAQYFGVAQRRRRVFVVADFGDGADPAEILFERKGVLGNHPPRRETGERIAPTPAARSKGRGGLGADFDCAVGLVTARMTDFGGYVEDGTASTLKQRDFKDATDLVAHCPAEVRDVAPTLTQNYGKQPDSSDTNAGPMLIPMQVAVAIQAGALRENPKSGPDGVGVRSDNLAYTLEARAEVQAVAFDSVQITSKTNRSTVEPGKPAPTMSKASMMHVAQAWAVRRLTPTECARLQGFPDDYCRIQYRGKEAADGPIYKALGNSWAVPCGAWILNRTARAIQESNNA